MSRLDHKKGRKSNYVKDSVNSVHHQDARLLILQRDNYECKVCKSKTNLEMHHISYHIVGKEVENLKWLCLLCSNCHQTAHNEADNIYNPKNPFKKCVLK